MMIRSTLFALALLGAMSAVAAAASIPIANPSFEAPVVVSPGTFIVLSAMTTQQQTDFAWLFDEGGYENNTAQSGAAFTSMFIWHERHTDAPAAPDGEQWINMLQRDDDKGSGTRFFQQIGTVDWVPQYQVDFTIGLLSNRTFTTDYSVKLLAGSIMTDYNDLTVLDSVSLTDAGSGLPTVTGGNTADASLLLDSDDTYAGQPLWLMFELPSHTEVDAVKQVMFDNIVVTAIPEPGTGLLLCVGGLLAMCCMGRRRNGR